MISIFKWKEIRSLNERKKFYALNYVVFYIIKIYDKMHVIFYTRIVICRL